MVASLFAVVGPTASGKTALAVRLAEAIGGEVVGADSVQIYRRFDVGSGKPTAEDRVRAPYHLVDCLDPREPMDAARWAALAEGALAEIRGRGRVPVLCGGTYLWVRALLRGLAPAPPADPGIRAAHAALAEHEGREALHRRLAAVDPAAAARLAPNDLVRVSRALEVYELSGVRQSEWHAQHGFREERHAARLVGVAWPRETLAARIGERAARMLAAGWVDEVRALLADGLGDARAMKSVGYRHIAEALTRSGADADAPEPATLAPTIERATRIFARRQRTWLRDEAVEWIEPGDVDAWIASARRQ